MALHEIEADRKPRTRLDNSLFSGWSWHRRYSCPTGSFETDIAALTLGRVLPLTEGGVATSNAGDPRLVSVKVDEKASGLSTYTDAVYVSIDVSGTPGVFNETTKSRVSTPGQFGDGLQTVAIATTTTDASIPALGETLAGGTPTLPTDYSCEGVKVVPNWQGRVLCLATFQRSILCTRS